MTEATGVPWAGQIVGQDPIREGDIRLIGTFTIALGNLQQVVVPCCREGT